MTAGVVDNRYKEIDPGVTVATMLMGTRRIYRFADRNATIHIRATSYTHDALVLGNFRRFVAVNGALEVKCMRTCPAEHDWYRCFGTICGDQYTICMHRC